MPLKCLLFLVLFTVTGLNVKSQTLLNADFSQIRKVVESEGGRLDKSFEEKDIEINGWYKKVVFLPVMSPPEGNSYLMKSSFCLTLEDKCFKYYEDYWGKELAEKKITELKRYYPELKQIKEALRWIDIDKRFEVDLTPKKIGKNKFASVYTLEIKQI